MNRLYILMFFCIDAFLFNIVMAVESQKLELRILSASIDEGEVFVEYSVRNLTSHMLYVSDSVNCKAGDIFQRNSFWVYKRDAVDREVRVPFSGLYVNRGAGVFELKPLEKLWCRYSLTKGYDIDSSSDGSYLLQLKARFFDAMPFEGGVSGASLEYSNIFYFNVGGGSIVEPPGENNP
ncbi:hypothetical protein ACJJIU_16455 [Microbulbifer sp. CnH-101-E]|uniref:hypothetical protein n=1 Tax=unclassified Microbulbifer TaxID=2619833 RepID=UPI0040391B52